MAMDTASASSSSSTGGQPPLHPPNLQSQSSNPISIRGKHFRVNRPIPKHLYNLSRSAPPLHYQPPKPPAHRPRVPSIDPPPIELPPSPPVFSQADVDKEIQRRKEHEQMMSYAQGGRSLNDYWSTSSSMPLPTFGPAPTGYGTGTGLSALKEKEEDMVAADQKQQQKTPLAAKFPTPAPTTAGTSPFPAAGQHGSMGANSYSHRGSMSENGTIFRLLQDSVPTNGTGSRSPSLTGRVFGGASRGQVHQSTGHGGGGSVVDDLQFDFSLHDDDSPMMDSANAAADTSAQSGSVPSHSHQAHVSKPSAFSLQFHDH